MAKVIEIGMCEFCRAEGELKPRRDPEESTGQKYMLCKACRIECAKAEEEALDMYAKEDAFEDEDEERFEDIAVSIERSHQLDDDAINKAEAARNKVRTFLARLNH